MDLRLIETHRLEETSSVQLVQSPIQSNAKFKVRSGSPGIFSNDGYFVYTLENLRLCLDLLCEFHFFLYSVKSSLVCAAWPLLLLLCTSQESLCILNSFPFH